MDRPLALVVDKDPALRAVIRDGFETHDMMVLGAEDRDEAIPFLDSRPVGIVLVELDEGSASADLDFVAACRKRAGAPLLVGLAPDGDTESKRSAVARWLGSGGDDVVEKPLPPAAVEMLALRVFRQLELRATLASLEERLGRREGFRGLVGRTDAMERVRSRIAGLARGTEPVWLSGEIGTGKELVARTLHEDAGAPAERFAAARCEELRPEDWDERWFGEGGLLYRAREGSVFLEELPKLAAELQGRLLATIRRVKAEGWPVRWLVSSSVPVSVAVDQGRVLPEIPQELGAQTVEIPPLRERAADVPLLARHFLDQIRAINRDAPAELDPEAAAILERFHWPANVQELRDTMEQAAVLSHGDRVRVQDLPESVRREVAEQRAGVTAGSVAATVTPGAPVRPFREAKKEVVEAFEESYLRNLMVHYGGNVTAASQRAGMLRSALQRLLRKYGLKSVEFRTGRRARSGGDTVVAEHGAPD